MMEGEKEEKRELVKSLSEIEHANSSPVKSSERQMLETLVASKALPAYIKNYAVAFAFNQFGKELGFATMQSFHYLTMINGKISLTVMAMEAMLWKNNIVIEKLVDAEYLYKDGTTAFGNYYEAEKGKPIDRISKCRLTRTLPNSTIVSQETQFTYQEAVAAELHDKDNWKKWRRDMLWSRCLSRAARRIAADIFLGLYTADELVDMSDAKEDDYSRNNQGYINVEVEDEPDEVDELTGMDSESENNLQ